MSDLPRVDITKPKWDQSTYMGRAKHFFVLTNPINVFASSAKLNGAKDIYDKYRAGKPLPPGTTMDDVWRAKYLYESAFHTETGEKNIVIGRMSAQMPMNTMITAGLLIFYKSKFSVIFWQWVNQSFNATVNYSNRSGDTSISPQQLATSYVLATGGALVTALSLNKQVKNLPPIIGRWVPFVAVAAANCINIPCMRMKEIREGVPIFDINNNKLGNSKKAAREGIAKVIVSRIFMATPSMIVLPIFLDRLDQRGFFKKYPKSLVPLNTGLIGLCLLFATPMCCALFSQTVSINISRLEDDIQQTAMKLNPSPKVGFYNKGL